MSADDNQITIKKQAPDLKAVPPVASIEVARRARKNREIVEAQNWLIERAKKLDW